MFYNITYQERNEAPPSDLRFHAHWRRENPTRKEIRYTILDAEGSGHYVGCHLNLQNREWWLRPPVKEIKFPRGFGLGMLEGWETIHRDGEATPSVHGTGTEDYFNGAWYFLSKEGRFSAPYHGCIVRDVPRGRVAAYRLVEAPGPGRAPSTTPPNPRSRATGGCWLAAARARVTSRASS